MLASMIDDAPRVTIEALQRLLDETIPFARMLRLRIVEIGGGRARVVMPGSPDLIRAGGTVNGGAIMTLADCAVYAAVLTRIGLEPMAVTSDLNVRFLRPSPPDDVHAEANVLRVGRRAAVAEVRMWNRDRERLVAHATATYALPMRADQR
jgi:uncharacterized protein (TIGR00369 family)